MKNKIHTGDLVSKSYEHCIDIYKHANDILADFFKYKLGSKKLDFDNIPENIPNIMLMCSEYISIYLAVFSLMNHLEREFEVIINLISEIVEEDYESIVSPYFKIDFIGENKDKILSYIKEKEKSRVVNPLHCACGNKHTNQDIM